jgi:hypothetical protein
LPFQADFAANGNIVDKLELSSVVVVQDFVKVSVIDNSANVVQFKGNSMLDLRKFAFNVEVRVLLDKFLHCLIDRILRVLRCKLLKVVLSDTGDHVLDCCAR